ncbi:MAG: sugar ABC transporter permease [Clostridia bacterium]|nr:sugar ABC transporter permease [Clostridia bacterium]
MIRKLREALRHNFREYAMFFALIAIVAFFGIATNGILLATRNVTRLIYQNSYILILAVGMLMCILTGGNIDLSVGSVVALASAMSGLLASVLGWPIWLSIILAMLVGVLAGAWQGYWIAYIQIPAFIVTLAGMLVFRAINNIILQGETVGLPDAYKVIAARPVADFVGEINVGQFGLNGTSMLVGALAILIYIAVTLWNRRTKKAKGYEVMDQSLLILKMVLISLVIAFFTLWLSLDDGLPIILVIFGVLAGIYIFITNKTVLGRHLYALGGNAKAAELSGIKTKRILFLAYTNMGMLSAISGIVYAGRLNASSPIAGKGFELDAIAACFIGGASATGGVGTVMGAIIGGLIMGILNNGMSIMSVDVFWQDFTKGLVLLGAVAFDVMSKSKSSVK